MNKRSRLYSGKPPYADNRSYDSRTLTDTLPRTVQFPLHDNSSFSNSSSRSSYHHHIDDDNISEVIPEPVVHVKIKDPHNHKYF